MKILKLSFEYIDPVAYPQFYCPHGDHPATDPATIADRYWKPVVIEAASPNEKALAMDQWNNLLQQVADGELLRNIRMQVAENLTPAWREITA
jgi:hypothetical protein